MMTWERLGLVYNAPFDNTWKHSSALTPTPLVLEDRVRVFAGLRDVSGVSRIGFVDLNLQDPTSIIGVSENPSLDIGQPGMFDDNGVILGDVFFRGEELWMYYVGFQLVDKVKFLAFTGLAISTDMGQSFSRLQETPVLDRRPNAAFFNAIHSVKLIGDCLHVWVGAGSSFIEIDGRSFPSYTVKHLISTDGISFSQIEDECITFQHPSEYRIGRPRVYQNKDGYLMHFTCGDIQGGYRMGSASSPDGLSWVRDDRDIDLLPTGNQLDWDGRHLCYGATFFSGNNEYMVYNGNDMGLCGFGIAVKKH